MRLRTRHALPFLLAAIVVACSTSEDATTTRALETPDGGGDGGGLADATTATDGAPRAPDGGDASAPAACAPAPEICDGVDNDCDGVVDEPVSSDRDCAGRSGPGSVCANGACACPVDTCAGACVDRATDPSNCGACGVACPPGIACAGGTCRCGAPYVTCAGRCVDLATDSANCGACGVACAGACGGGRCVVTLASGGDTAFSVAVDATSVYWSDTSSIRRAGLDGSNPTVLAAGLPGRGRTLAIDGTALYWADPGSFSNAADGRIVSLPLAGGIPVTIASRLIYPLGVVASGGDVYWVNYGTGAGADGAVVTVPSGGGQVTTLASALSRPSSLAVGASSVYWTSFSGGVYAVPRGGGAISSLEANATGASTLGVAATSGAVYWIESSAILSVPLAGGTPSTIATSPDSAIGSPVIDGANAYVVYASNDPSSRPSYIGRVAVGGGAVTTMAIANVNGIAVDATSLYWVDGSGAVKKTPK